MSSNHYFWRADLRLITRKGASAVFHSLDDTINILEVFPYGLLSPWIVTLLRGSSDCTMHSDFPSFLTTQNHRDLYNELDG